MISDLDFINRVIKPENSRYIGLKDTRFTAFQQGFMIHILCDLLATIAKKAVEMHQYRI